MIPGLSDDTVVVPLWPAMMTPRTERLLARLRHTRTREAYRLARKRRARLMNHRLADRLPRMPVWKADPGFFTSDLAQMFANRR